MKEKLKVAVVGAGRIWRSHWNGWKDSPHAELVAFADMNRESLDRVCNEKNITRRYDSAEELYSQRDIDIIDICTHTASHAELVLSALKAKKHVLCEKPLATHPDEIREMIRLRDENNVLLMTAQHFRFYSSAMALKKEIESGALGNIYHARTWMLRQSGGSLRPTFISKKLSCGGAVMDIGVHALDLTLWLMGNPKPVSVTGLTQDKIRQMPGAFVGNGKSIPDFWDVDEFACSLIRFENGASLILEVSWLLNHKGNEHELEIWLYGDKAGVHWPSNILSSINVKEQKREELKIDFQEGREPHAEECMSFAKAIATGLPSPVPAEESLDVISILEAVYRSSNEACEVPIYSYIRT